MHKFQSLLAWIRQLFCDHEEKGQDHYRDEDPDIPWTVNPYQHPWEVMRVGVAGFNQGIDLVQWNLKKNPSMAAV